jgi:hypothetical protein
MGAIPGTSPRLQEDAFPIQWYQPPPCRHAANALHRWASVAASAGIIAASAGIIAAWRIREVIMEQHTHPIAIEIDAGRETGLLARNWRYIGYDENNYTHTPEGEALLADFGAMEAAPCFVRTHHMLCTGNLHGVYKWGSTNAYSEDDAGNPVYTWDTVDRILDTLLRSNCKPFFELGFLPFHLVDPKHFEGMSDFQQYDAYKRQFWAYPPKDYGKWQDLIAACRQTGRAICRLPVNRCQQPAQQRGVFLSRSPFHTGHDIDERRAGLLQNVADIVRMNAARKDHRLA